MTQQAGPNEESSTSSVLRQRLDRRAFMTRAAILGATAAAAPVLMGAVGPAGIGAQPGPPPGRGCPSINPLLVRRYDVTRSEVGIDGAEVDGAPVRIRAYAAAPIGVDNAPGILVIHENQGLQPYQRDVVDGLATSGYHAVVADLLSREGGTAIVEDRSGGLSAAPQDRHVEDLQSTLAYLRDQVGSARVGIVGFCFGGALTWRMATEADGLSAVVPFYGAAPQAIQDAAGEIEAAVFAVYAENDNNVNATRDGILAALDAAGVTHETMTYPGTGHAFHNHTREDRYNPQQAQRAWEDTLAWFDQHLLA